jgi:hypothetical protein
MLAVSSASFFCHIPYGRQYFTLYNDGHDIVGVQRRLGKQFVRFGVQEGMAHWGVDHAGRSGFWSRRWMTGGVWCRWVTGVPTSGWGRIGVRTVVYVVRGRSVVWAEGVMRWCTSVGLAGVRYSAISRSGVPAVGGGVGGLVFRGGGREIGVRRMG